MRSVEVLWGGGADLPLQRVKGLTVRPARCRVVSGEGPLLKEL